MQPILLLTRPQRQSRRFAARARAVLPPHETLVAPLSDVVAVPYDTRLFDGVHGVVLTSANALPFLPSLPGLPAWCVGPATAAAARAAGFVAYEGGGDAAALIETLAAKRPEGPLVHAHGTHMARDLVAALRPRGIDLRGVAVYEARALDWPETALHRLAMADRVIVPLFSPRAADGFVRHLERVPGMDLQHVTPVAISPTCAAKLPDALRANAHMADQPDAEGMLRALGQALSDPRSHPGPLA